MSNKRYDERGNLIYLKCADGLESWHSYDERNREIFMKRSDGYESRKVYNEKSNLIHIKTNQLGNENIWYKIEKNKEIRITQKEYYKIEFLSRKYCSRFELIDI